MNPQFFKRSAACTGANNNSVECALPVQRLNNKNRSMVMEVLKVQWVTDAKGVTGHTHMAIGVQAAPSGTTAPTGEEGYVQIFHKRANTSPQEGTDFWQDVTDGQGHGVLIATDKIYIITNGGEATNTNKVYCNILYRWKNVSLQEYIGIVQSSTA